MARRAVSARTVDVYTSRQGAALAFASVTVLLVRMGLAELRFWSDLLGGQMDGTDPVDGYEVRASDGALLGVILPLGNKASRMHIEWYDPATDDFYPAGRTDTVMTQGISRVLGHYRRNVGDVPVGRDTLLDPEPVRLIRNRFCPWVYCFDAECVDHGPVWAVAA
ncbi:hypothetical protein [Streptomyces salinarius]|uniref:hypothetical protein n=1 Tax=Streptomyces salinarius TaxID=2762598 RepID=UPI0028526019|nr:hypothetical protein [Streptomyces salinarius]